VGVAVEARRRAFDVVARLFLAVGVEAGSWHRVLCARLINAMRTKCYVSFLLFFYYLKILKR
jgi:hypothetical protein